MQITGIEKITLKNPVKVYDVMNANPYNNFLIKTGNKYVVSHNCGL